MKMNWLYGPPMMVIAEHMTQRIDYRSLVLHLDAVRAVVARLDAKGYSVELHAEVRDDVALMNTSTPFTLAQLGDLPTGDRAGIWVMGRSPNGDVSLPLLSFMTPQATFNSETSNVDAREMVSLLLKEGRPRVQWFRLAPVAALAPLLLMASWIWALAATDPPLSLVVAGTLVAASCVYSLRALPSQLRTLLLAKTELGHRIVPVSRNEVYLARGSRRRQIGIALLGAATPVVLAGLVALFVRVIR